MDKKGKVIGLGGVFYRFKSPKNFRVDDIKAILARLQENHVEILNEVSEYEYGEFLQIKDPEGNRIELWKPVDTVFQKDSGAKMPM